MMNEKQLELPRILWFHAPLFNTLVPVYLAPGLIDSANNRALYGMTVWGRGMVTEVLIEPTLPPAVLRETVLHELLHVVELTLDWSWKETQVDLGGKCLAQLLGDMLVLPPLPILPSEKAE